MTTKRGPFVACLALPHSAYIPAAYSAAEVSFCKPRQAVVPSRVEMILVQQDPLVAC